MNAAAKRERHVKRLRLLHRFLSQVTAEVFKGTPIEAGYKRLSPTPNEFPNFIKRVISIDLKPHDFGAARLKATKVPMFFIHCDADGVRLDYIAETFRLKGGESHGEPGAGLGLDVGHFARHNSRHTDGPHVNYRPDGERLSRCQAAKAITVFELIFGWFVFNISTK
jgi:hypothetical protein